MKINPIYKETKYLGIKKGSHFDLNYDESTNLKGT